MSGTAVGERESVAFYTQGELVKASPRERWVPPKPSRGGFAVKALQPGSRLTWSRVLSGRWCGMPGSGTWVGPSACDVSGTVWSEGPYPRSLWVTADGEGYPSLVIGATPSRLKRGDAPWSEQSGSGERARLSTLRYQSLMRHGEVFAVSHGKQDTGYHEHHGLEFRVSCMRCTYPTHVVMWHADRECPEIGGRPWAPDHYQSFYAPIDVARIVTGDTEECRSPSRLCNACIWLRPATDDARDYVAARASA